MGRLAEGAPHLAQPWPYLDLRAQLTTLDQSRAVSWGEAEKPARPRQRGPQPIELRPSDAGGVWNVAQPRVVGEVSNTINCVLIGTSSNFGNMFSAAGASIFLKFLPMLPTQILLNNLLYDASEMTIPTDNVDQELLHTLSYHDAHPSGRRRRQ